MSGNTAGQTAGDLLKAGKLSDALTAAQNAVRKAPTDLNARILLAEILVFAGNLERAENPGHHDALLRSVCRRHSAGDCPPAA